MSCLALNGPSPQGTRLRGHLPDSENPKLGCRGPGRMLSLVIRRSWSGLIGDEIMPVCGHCSGVEDIGTDQARV
jgi:hypothetical protein